MGLGFDEYDVGLCDLLDEGSVTVGGPGQVSLTSTYHQASVVPVPNQGQYPFGVGEAGHQM